MKKGINNEIEIYQNLIFTSVSKKTRRVCVQSVLQCMGKGPLCAYIHRASAFSIASSDVSRRVGVRLPCNYRSRAGLPPGEYPRLIRSPLRSENQNSDKFQFHYLFPSSCQCKNFGMIIFSGL